MADSPTRFEMGKQQVVITAVPTEAVSFVKSLRLIADLGLGDAKNLSYYLAASLPCVLVAGVDQEVADHILSLLQEAGAGAKTEDSSLDVPMLLCPEANEKYRWSWLGGRVSVD